jgi:hypothetical protein
MPMPLNEEDREKYVMIMKTLVEETEGIEWDDA